MITTINEWKRINESNDIIYSTLIHELKKMGIDSQNKYRISLSILLNDKFNEVRISEYNDYLVMEMIYLDEKVRKMGYGEKIYTALLNTSKKLNYKGIFSPAFDIDSGQQRSKEATNLLLKLSNKFKSKVIDITNEVDQDDIYDMIDEGIPHFGPPYLDIYIYNK